MRPCRSVELAASLSSSRCCRTESWRSSTNPVAIPFATHGQPPINPNLQGNEVGIEANVAFFGFVIDPDAIFNSIDSGRVSITTAESKVCSPLHHASIAATIISRRPGGCHPDRAGAEAALDTPIQARRSARSRPGNRHGRPLGVVHAADLPAVSGAVSKRSICEIRP